MLESARERNDERDTMGRWRWTCAGVVAVLVWVSASAPGWFCRGAEVWMPDVGEVDLEQAPRDDLPERVKHACGLVGAGNPRAGRRQLAALLEEHPDADWADQARLVTGRALIGEGRHKEAFGELGALIEQTDDEATAGAARRLQRLTAAREAERHLGRGLAMYNHLLGSAASQDEAADIQREKADAIYRAEHWLEAEDEYRALVDIYPGSEWVPYCWYRMADCKWEAAGWLELGVESVREAADRYADFAAVYPGHPFAAEARAKAEAARSREAELYEGIAEFYRDAERRPWAAAGYLEHLVERFGDLPAGDWARTELERTDAELPAPRRGTLRALPIEGVRVAAEAGTEAGA
jgi:hypothetical protein